MIYLGDLFNLNKYYTIGIFIILEKADFKWAGTGEQLFNSSQKGSKNDSGAGDDTGNGDEEFDPHYEPIVPLPDKIVISTGEEEEVVIL